MRCFERVSAGSKIRRPGRETHWKGARQVMYTALVLLRAAVPARPGLDAVVRLHAITGLLQRVRVWYVQ
jgi:hypothetical protein